MKLTALTLLTATALSASLALADETGAAELRATSHYGKLFSWR